MHEADMAQRNLRPGVQTMDERMTSFGRATYIRVFTPDYRKLSWMEIWEAFEAIYPGKWAVEFFPPKDQLLDEENIYHLYVLEDNPSGVNIHPYAMD